MPSPDYAALAGQQRGRVQSTRAGRDETGYRAAIGALSDGASGNACMMPLLVDAVRARATVGEISDALRESWGVYRPA